MAIVVVPCSSTEDMPFYRFDQIETCATDRTNNRKKAPLYPSPVTNEKERGDLLPGVPLPVFTGTRLGPVYIRTRYVARLR
jgi:hypothetical protein